MKNVIASVSCLDTINKITALINELLYASETGFMYLTSKDVISGYENVIEKYDYEVSKILTSTHFLLSDDVIKSKKRYFISRLKEHYSSQLEIWCDETYFEFVDNSIFELSVDKNNSDFIFNNLVCALNWYSSIKNLSKTKYNALFCDLQTKFQKALHSTDSDFIPVALPIKSIESEFMAFWNMILENEEEFLKIDFQTFKTKLSAYDIQLFESIKNKILSSKKQALIDEIIFINSTVKILKLQDDTQKYNLIMQILSDFSSKHNTELSEEEKIKLIKRRIALFNDENKTTKDYFIKLIIS